MLTTEFSASASKTFPLFLLMAALTAAFGIAAASTWSNAWISGALLVPAALCFIGVLILGYRLLARPVMLRVGPDGVFLKRLGVTLPWQALARIERIDWQGETLFALIPAEERHPVLDENSVLLGAALNERLGLPALVVQMSQYRGRLEDFETAVHAAGGPPILARH